jgi:signal transduction histidine kinase
MLPVNPILPAEDGLRDVGEERFQLIARASNEVIWDWDIQTGLCWQSPSIRAFGYSEATQRGERPWLDHVHPDHFQRVLEGVEEVLGGQGCYWSDEYPFLCHNGVIANVFNRACVVRDSERRGIRMIGAMMDMTGCRPGRGMFDDHGADQKSLEAHFLRAQRVESISTLVNRIAHDLNNVLSPILMGVPFLKEQATDPFCRRILAEMESSAARAPEIVKQFLTLARGAAGERAMLQPNQLIQELVKILGETFPKSIRIQTCCDPALCDIEGDAMELHQVLLNLCANARDAMPDGGALTLSSHNVTLTDPVSCGGLSGPSGQYVQIQVADTGVGMTEELQEKIFQPYFTTKDPGTGAGVGLSTTVRILRSHCALLGLESGPGSGTTFSVYFPARPPRPNADAAEVPPASRTGKHQLVLLVDDEAAIREMCKLILECYHYRVLTAENGAEALSLMERHKGQVSAVIIDMMMPVMDGPAAIRAMRWSAPQLKIIATSGLSQKEQSATLGDAAPDIFLQKPYSADQLVAALASLLG